MQEAGSTEDVPACFSFGIVLFINAAIWRKKTFPKSTEQYFKQPFFPYSISIFRVSSRPSHFEQNN